MARNRMRLWRLVAIAACGALAAGAAAADTPIEQLLEQLPAQSPEQAQQVAGGLVAAGPAGIKALVGMLAEPAKGGDAKVRYALHGMAIHVARPGAEAERKAFAEALAAELAADHAPAIKGFLIRQLQLAGGPEAADAVADLLLDGKLGESAAQALLAMRCERKAERFRAALARARGARRVTLVQAVGLLRDRASVGKLLPLARDADRTVRIAVYDALGGIGDAAAADLLLQAAEAQDAYERIKAAGAALELGRRLADAGQKQPAERIFRTFWRRTGAQTSHLRAAALRGLAAIGGDQALDEVAAALHDEDLQIRRLAAKVALAMGGARMTRWWIERLKSAPADAKAGILAMLGARGDAAALPAALEALKSSEKAVRLAAIEAVGALAAEKAVAPLAGFLADADGDQRRAANHALIRAAGGPKTHAAIARQLQAASAPAARGALLKLLAARNAADRIDVVLAAASADPAAEARLAAVEALGVLAGAEQVSAMVGLLASAKTANERSAIEIALTMTAGRVGRPCAEPLAAGMKGARAEVHAALLRALGKAGGKRALAAFRGAVGHANAEVRDAAVRTLAEWPTPDAADELLAIVKAADNATHQVLALRGYMRLMSKANRPVADKLAMYKTVLAAAKRRADKILVLSGMGELASLEAMNTVLPYLAEAGLREEAAAAVTGIADRISGTHRGAVASALGKVLAAAKARRTRDKAEAIFERLNRDRDYITAWVVSGPYTRAIEGKGLFDTPFAPETDPGRAEWKPVGSTGWRIDLRSLIGGGNRAAYLRTRIFSPREIDARLETGSDDGAKVWLNGKVVVAKPGLRGLRPGEDKVDVRLRKGWNTLLVKVTQGDGGWEACAKLVSRQTGKPISGLRYQPGQ